MYYVEDNVYFSIVKFTSCVLYYAYSFLLGFLPGNKGIYYYLLKFILLV